MTKIDARARARRLGLLPADELVEDLFTAGIEKLTNDRALLVSLLAEQAGTDIGRFMNRVLWWRFHPENKQLLWDLFSEVIDMSEVGFMGSFYSFVSNDLLDDGGFRISVGSHGDPVVVYDSEGNQDPSELMEAMDRAELEYTRRIASLVRAKERKEV